MPELNLDPVAEPKYVAVRLQPSEWMTVVRWIKKERRSKNPRAGIREFITYLLDLHKNK